MTTPTWQSEFILQLPHTCLPNVAQVHIRNILTRRMDSYAAPTHATSDLIHCALFPSHRPATPRQMTSPAIQWPVDGNKLSSGSKLNNGCKHLHPSCVKQMPRRCMSDCCCQFQCLMKSTIFHTRGLQSLQALIANCHDLSTSPSHLALRQSPARHSCVI